MAVEKAWKTQGIFFSYFMATLYHHGGIAIVRVCPSYMMNVEQCQEVANPPTKP